MHVTFCEQFVFQEFKRILYITLTKFSAQELLKWHLPSLVWSSSRWVIGLHFQLPVWLVDLDRILRSQLRRKNETESFVFLTKFLFSQIENCFVIATAHSYEVMNLTLK